MKPCTSLPINLVLGRCIFLLFFPIHTLVYSIFLIKKFALDHNFSDVLKTTEYLQSNEIAHNMFMTRGTSFDNQEDTVRIYVWGFPT
jgi:hypothetical protein